MGLTLSIGNGAETFDMSYTDFNKVRHLAYLSVGGKNEFHAFMCRLREDDYDFNFLKYYTEYRNLAWHSDCEGSYGLRGKAQPYYNHDGRLLTGNSKQLLKELKSIQVRIAKIDDEFGNIDNNKLSILNNLTMIVSTAIDKYNGRIELHG